MKKDIFDPSYISENDNLRSYHIQKVVQGENNYNDSESYSSIPKTIIQFWHNLNDLPEDVEECIASWNVLKDNGFDLLLFDTKRAEAFIKEYMGSKYLKAFKLCNHPAMKCDYFRLCYIYLFGGFYIDADEVYLGADINYLFSNNILKLQPLCYEINTGLMVSPDRFMNRKETSNDWIFYLNNNPIISPPKHPIISLALERSTLKIINSNTNSTDIQSITGPGNITASVVKHSLILSRENKNQDFFIIPNWEHISETRWPLSYRDDERNWRIWDSSKRWEDCNF